MWYMWDYRTSTVIGYDTTIVVEKSDLKQSDYAKGLCSVECFNLGHSKITCSVILGECVLHC